MVEASAVGIGTRKDSWKPGSIYSAPWLIATSVTFPERVVTIERQERGDTGSEPSRCCGQTAVVQSAASCGTPGFGMEHASSRLVGHLTTSMTLRNLENRYTTIVRKERRFRQGFSSSVNALERVLHAHTHSDLVREGHERETIRLERSGGGLALFVSTGMGCQLPKGMSESDREGVVTEPVPSPADKRHPDQAHQRVAHGPDPSGFRVVLCDHGHGSHECCYVTGRKCVIFRLVMVIRLPPWKWVPVAAAGAGDLRALPAARSFQKLDDDA
jgi:hypothetical protein